MKLDNFYEIRIAIKSDVSSQLFYNFKDFDAFKEPNNLDKFDTMRFVFVLWDYKLDMIPIWAEQKYYDNMREAYVDWLCKGGYSV